VARLLESLYHRRRHITLLVEIDDAAADDWGEGAVMDWARILAYVIGTVDKELLARPEYLAAENGILKSQLKGRLKLSDAERATLGETGHGLGCESASNLDPTTVEH
jgi:hypothetical protein